MQSRVFIKVWFVTIGIITILIAFLNYMIDPFGVFHTRLLTKSKSLNERVVKIDYLNEHKDKYNAFMIGSSTIGTTDPKVLEEYIPNTHYYNLTCSSSNMYDYKLMISYLLEHDFDVKHIYLQIDMTSIRDFGEHNNYGQKHHYALTDTSAWKFYFEYLTIMPSLAMFDKVKVNLEDIDVATFDIEDTGRWFVPYKDKARKKDLDTYIKTEHSFSKVSRRTRGIEKNFNAIIKSYEEIVTLCQEHGVDLVVLTTAYNHIRMDEFKIKDSITFLKMLAKYHDVWYFSGYNSVTTEDKNYYEVNHYVPEIGMLKAARIYHDDSVAIPHDFGVLLSRTNSNMVLAQEEQKLLGAKTE